MVLWPGTQRIWDKEEAKGKNRIILPPAAPARGWRGGLLLLGSSSVAANLAGNHLHVPGAGVLGHRSCRTTAGEGEGRRSCGPRSVGEGRDIEIQTGGSLLPSATLALLKIEL